MVAPVRRVVTGHDENGKAVIIFDGNAENTKVRPGGTGSSALWRTHATPANNSGSDDSVLGDIPLQPPAGGSVFRVVEFAPDADMPEGPGVAEQLGAHSAEGAAARHPGTHRTDSIDYAIVMTGEIDMLMDEEKDDVHLKAGDVVIQRGTNHAWANCTDKPCQIAFILIDADPAI